jgi:hypothetical protein
MTAWNSIKHCGGARAARRRMILLEPELQRNMVLGSKLDVQHKWIIKTVTNCNSFLSSPFTFITFKKRKQQKKNLAPPPHLMLTFLFFKVGLATSIYTVFQTANTCLNISISTSPIATYISLNANSGTHVARVSNHSATSSDGAL